MSAQEVSWKGQSGKSYTYEIHPLEASFKNEPGNYIFARLAGRLWHAVYIGETGDLGKRLANHNEEECVQRHGATHIHAHLSSSNKAERLAEEKDLTDAHNPPCNG